MGLISSQQFLVKFFGIPPQFEGKRVFREVDAGIGIGAGLDSLGRTRGGFAERFSAQSRRAMASCFIGVVASKH